MDDATTQATAQVTSTYNLLSGITWDTRLSGTSIGLYFYPAGQSVVTPTATYTTTALNEYQESRFEAALTTFSNITKLNFGLAPKPEAAPLRLFQAEFPVQQDETNVLLGFAFAPGFTGAAGLQGYNAGAPGWSTTAGGTLEAGGNAFTTLIHELGHSFGLAHPHDTGGGSTIFPEVTNAFRDAGTFGLNQGIYTMMSYRDGWADGPADLPARVLTYGEESTPMALDIAVLQQKYGANTTYRTGDDVYALPDQNIVGTSYQSIWDAGGRNSIEYRGASDAVIDLRPASLQFEQGGGGWVSYVKGIRGGYTIANGVTIQTAISGSGNDLLTASDFSSMLSAGTGQNTIIGGAGNDTVVSAGNDTITAGGGANLIAIGAGKVVVSSAGQDTVIAGSGANVVGVATGGSDIVFGGAGSLIFIGGAASSTVVGGSGSATVFGGAGGGVLAGGAAGGNVMVSGTGAATLFGGGNGDVIFVQGSGQVIQAGRGNETLSGGSATGGNTFFAGSGADLIGGGAGADVFFAGTGQATVFGAGGANQFVFKQGLAGQTVIGDFNQAAGDRIVLQGFAANAGQTALANASLGGGGTIITLSDNTRITLVGIASLSPTALG